MNIDVYTDGACSGNPGKGGYGIFTLKDGSEFFQTCGGYRHTTNNRMEIKAAAKALDEIRTRIPHDGTSRDTDIKVTVYSDSQVVVRTMNDGWSRNANRDLWNELDAALSALRAAGAEVSFLWVKGHDKNAWNNKADELAVYGSHNRCDQIDTYYENINPVVRNENLLFPSVDPVPEPTVTEVRLLHCDGPVADRSVLVRLSNGTDISIHGCHGGFEQYGGTTQEFRITLPLAYKFTRWLNGGSLCK